jgi:hypothetical protein
MSLDERVREQTPEHLVHELESLAVEAAVAQDRPLAPVGPGHGEVGLVPDDRVAELDSIAWNLPVRQPERYPPDAAWPPEDAA